MSISDSGAQYEELGKVMGELAHEIKNPLSTIKVNLKLVHEELERLEDDRKDSHRPASRALRKVTVVQKETERLEHILNNFLRYVDKPHLQLETLDVNVLVNDMIDFFSPQACGRHITIRQSLSEKPLECRLDPVMLKQSILNIFLNAKQAMPEGGELMVRTEQAEGCAIIQISDTGCGIAEDELPRIVEAYYSTKPEGSGLGLPTARRIVEAHGGSITVDSVPGKGTMFRICVPQKKQN